MNSKFASLIWAVSEIIVAWENIRMSPLQIRFVINKYSSEIYVCYLGKKFEETLVGTPFSI